MKNAPSRCHDFAVADKGQTLFSSASLASGSIGRHAEHTILQTAGDHGIRTMRQDEIRWMRNELGAFEGQGPRGFRIEPIEANHHPKLGRADVPYLKPGITWIKEQGFFEKQMGLAIAADEST